MVWPCDTLLETLTGAEQCQGCFLWRTHKGKAVNYNNYLSNLELNYRLYNYLDIVCVEFCFNFGYLHDFTPNEAKRAVKRP